MQYVILIYVVLYINVSVCNENRIFYFAYGSNLLASRMHINIPRAELHTTAFLENYSLGFQTVVPMWNGAVATIYEDPGETVWGVIWIIDREDLEKLNKQEGVSNLLYHAINVTVMLKQVLQEVTARTYVQTNITEKLPPGTLVPFNRRPSISYREAIIFGAIEVGLPKVYVALLRKIPHNGKLASKEMRQKLGKRFSDQMR